VEQASGLEGAMPGTTGRCSGWRLRRLTSGQLVAHDVAVKNLVAQLALLTDSDHATAHQESDRQQESSLVNLLGVLLDSQ